MSQQGLRQSMWRDIAGSSLDYNGDLIAAAEAITGNGYGHVNEAEIGLLQALTGTSLTDLNGLRAQYAEMVGASNWSSVGNIYSPRAIDDLLIWCRADGPGFLGAIGVGGVSQWDDLSGKGYDFVQGTSADQPPYAANAINGLPALDPDGTSDDMLAPDTGETVTAETIFLVAHTPPFNNSTNDFSVLGNAGNAAYRIRFRDGTIGGTYNIDFAITGFTDGTDALRNATGCPPDSDVILRAERSVADDFIGLYANGTLLKSTTHSSGSIANYRPRLFSSTGVEEFWNQYVSEVAIYNRRLSAAEIARAEAYLSEKYGIAV